MASRRPFVDIYLMIVGLVVTNAIVWALLGLKISQWSTTTIDPRWVVNNRSTIAIAVQVIAQILGMTVVAVLCKHSLQTYWRTSNFSAATVINLSTRAKLTYGSFSLESLNFLNALCALRPDWTLGIRRLVFLFLFIAFSFAPAALWAGAITPLISDVQNQARITVPRYHNISGSIVSPAGMGDEALTKITEQGIFTYRPELLLQGVILDNVRHASSLDKGPIAQAKMDNTNFRYIGRSYGVGSSVGLKTPFVNPLVQSYQYVETGIQVTSNCIYNDSSACYFSNLTPENWSLNVYNGNFQLPNSNGSYIIASAGQRDYQILVVSAGSGKGVISDNTTHYAVMMSPAGAKGTQYGRLEQIQCEIRYEPTDFQVFVNATNNTIAVSPISPADESAFTNFTDIPPAITHRLYNIGQLFASTQWGSPMGDAFMNNVNNLAFFRNERPITNATVLEAVSASWNSMIDSILEALSGSQTMVLNDSTDIPVTITSQTVVFGDRVYIYAIVTINTIITSLFIIELIRTGVWGKTPGFDYMSVLDLVLATSAGGTAISKEAHLMSLSESAGHIRIMLTEGTDGNDMLVAAQDRFDNENFGVDNEIRNGRTFQLTSRRGYEQL